jgi:hypothetical protein
MHRVFPDAFGALEIRVVPAMWKTGVIDVAQRSYRVTTTGAVVRNPRAHDFTLIAELEKFFHTTWSNKINEAYRRNQRVENALVRNTQRSASLNHLRREIVSIRERLIKFRDLIECSGLSATFRQIRRNNAARLVDAIALGINDEIAKLDTLDFRRPSSDEMLQNRIAEFRKIVQKRHGQLGVKVVSLCGARRHVAKNQWTWDRMKKRFFDEDLPQVEARFYKLRPVVDRLKMLQRKKQQCGTLEEGRS